MSLLLAVAITYLFAGLIFLLGTTERYTLWSKAYVLFLWPKILFDYYQTKGPYV